MTQRFLSEQEQLLYTIIQYGAPTLYGEKTASLINFKNSKVPVHRLWQHHKHEVMAHLKVDYIELKQASNRSLVLFYNRDLLKVMLQCERHQVFLTGFGYEHFNVDYALERLKSRFKEACPHEIGVFLGYPLGDVKCFASCKHQTCLATGYWKVYENLDGAKKTFALYDHIKYKFMKIIESGNLPSEALRSIKGDVI